MFLVVDLEATCWETKNVADINEIIEIGIAVCDSSDAYLLDSCQFFVKPKIHPILSKFCKDLTKIKQEWIDPAPPLSIVVEDAKKWLKEKHNQNLCDTIWTSWGDFDRKCIFKDCARNNIPYFMGKHCSAKSLYSNICGCKKMGVASALKRERMRFEGTQHRAKDDAVNIARIIRARELHNKILDLAVEYTADNYC